MLCTVVSVGGQDGTEAASSLCRIHRVQHTVVITGHQLRWYPERSALMSSFFHHGSHQATEIKFPDIPLRFLKIPDGVGSIYHVSGRLHLPYTDDPLLSFFSVQVSMGSGIFSTYNCCILVSDIFSSFSSCVYCHLQMQIITVSLAKAYENVSFLTA